MLIISNLVKALSLLLICKKLYFRAQNIFKFLSCKIICLVFLMNFNQVFSWTFKNTDLLINLVIFKNNTCSDICDIFFLITGLCLIDIGSSSLSFPKPCFLTFPICWVFLTLKSFNDLHFFWKMVYTLMWYELHRYLGVKRSTGMLNGLLRWKPLSYQLMSTVSVSFIVCKADMKFRSTIIILSTVCRKWRDNK